MTKSEFRMTLKIGEMKVPMILVLSIIAHADYAAAQTSQTDLSPKPQTTLEREIESLEEARNLAVLHGDVAALDRMTSDDYTFITLRGELRTKSDILKGFASGSFHYDSYRAVNAERNGERQGLQRRLPVHQGVCEGERTLGNGRSANNFDPAIKLYSS